jgi:CRP/FNR family transcriptional regulator
MDFETKKKQIKNNQPAESLLSFFSKIGLFSKLSKRELKILSLYCYERKYKANETIFKIGYPNVAFYIVKEGLLSVYIEENERKIEIQKVEPMQFIGEIGLFLEDTRTVNIEALEDSELIAISKKEFVKFIETKPRTGIKILYKLGEILSGQVLYLSHEKAKKGIQ